MKQVTKDMLIGDMLRMDIGIAPILMASGMHCVPLPGVIHISTCGCSIR